MRQIRYIEFCVEILQIVTLATLMYLKIIELNLLTVLAYLSIEIVVKLYFTFYYKKLRKEGKLALITESKPKWKKPVIILSIYVIVLLWMYSSYEFESLKTHFILPFYFISIGVIIQLFAPNNGDFHIDQLGFINTPIFFKSYKWEEINNFEIGNNSIGYSLKKENFMKKISHNSMTEVLNLNLKI